MSKKIFCIVVMAFFCIPVKSQPLHERLSGRWVNGPDGFDIDHGCIRKIHFKDSVWEDTGFSFYCVFDKPRVSLSYTEELFLLSYKVLRIDCVLCTSKRDPHIYSFEFCKIELLPEGYIRLSFTDREDFSADVPQSDKRLLKEANSLFPPNRPFTSQFILQNINSLKQMPHIQL